MASHKTLASWYQQIAQTLESGVPLAGAIELAAGPSQADRIALSRQIQSGMPLDDVLRGAPRWLPRQDRLFISAAARTGRLPQTFSNLAERHSRVGANQLKGILSLLYPLGIFHFGVLITPVVGMIDFEKGFQWNTAAYLGQVAGMLLPLWGIIGLIIFLAKTDSPLLPRLIRCIPILRGYSKSQALADFSYALGTFLDAGTPIRKSWQGAAAVAHDPALSKATRALDAVLVREQDPGPELKRHSCFPPDFVAMYQAGARSGQLDQNLLRLGRQFQEKANTRMTLAAIVYPTILFLLVAGFLVFSILSMYSNYLHALTGMME